MTYSRDHIDDHVSLPMALCTLASYAFIALAMWTALTMDYTPVEDDPATPAWIQELDSKCCPYTR